MYWELLAESNLQRCLRSGTSPARGLSLMCLEWRMLEPLVVVSQRLWKSLSPWNLDQHLPPHPWNLSIPKVFSLAPSPPLTQMHLNHLLVLFGPSLVVLFVCVFETGLLRYCYNVYFTLLWWGCSLQWPRYLDADSSLQITLGPVTPSCRKTLRRVVQGRKSPLGCSNFLDRGLSPIILSEGSICPSLE